MYVAKRSLISLCCNMKCKFSSLWLKSSSSMMCMNEWRVRKKSAINTLSAFASIKNIFKQANVSTNVSPTHVQQLKICYQPLCWITASLTVCLMGTHAYTYTHSCHQKPHKSATIPIPLWLYFLYRRAPSTSHCMSQHFGVTLHHPSWRKQPSI